MGQRGQEGRPSRTGAVESQPLYLTRAGGWREDVGMSSTPHPTDDGPRPQGRQSQTRTRREIEGHGQVVADTDAEDRQVGYVGQTQRWER